MQRIAVSTNNVPLSTIRLYDSNHVQLPSQDVQKLVAVRGGGGGVCVPPTQLGGMGEHCKLQ